MAGEVEAAQEQALDAWRLGTLVRESLRKSSRFELGEARQVLTRVAGLWPGEPTDLMRLAAISRHLDDSIDSLWPQMPERLQAMAAAPEPWSVDDAEAIVDLAQLVIFERLDYMVACRPFLEPDLRLRALLVERDDVNTLTAAMRWSSMLRLQMRAPENSLSSWEKHTKSIAERPEIWEVSEYGNTLNIRGSLEHYCSLLTGPSQAKWRELIEPADEIFRAATEVQDTPITLDSMSGRLGGWWYYRSPPGVDWASSRVRLKPDRWFPVERPGGIQPFSFISRLARRKNGVPALTDSELEAWTASVRRQSESEQRRGKSGHWTDLFEAAEAERLRRAG